MEAWGEENLQKVVLAFCMTHRIGKCIGHPGVNSWLRSGTRRGAYSRGQNDRVGILEMA
jgi:hypothetical protein